MEGPEIAPHREFREPVAAGGSGRGFHLAKRRKEVAEVLSAGSAGSAAVSSGSLGCNSRTESREWRANR